MPEEGHDQYGRYLIVPQGGGKPVPHTRVTTFASTLDDRYALEKWSQRMVAIGLSRRADLLAGVAAARDDDKRRIDALVVDAIEAAEATRGRNIGTALHKFTERVDLHELDVEQVPDPWHADIAAYVNAVANAEFQMELIEQTVVIEQLDLAGTLDRTVLRDGVRYIFDVKTGQGLGLQSCAIQLACYAHASSLYDRDHGVHSLVPEINQEIGYVAHCPAGKGTCEIVALDLVKGWRGALLASQVRSFRKSKVQVAEFRMTRPLWLRSQVKRLVDEYPEAARDLAALWPPGVPTLKTNGHSPDQIQAIVDVLIEVEGIHQVPFGEPDPAPTTNKERNVA